MNPTMNGKVKAQIEVLVRSAHLVGAQLMRGSMSYPESEDALAKIIDEMYSVLSSAEPKYESEVV